PRFSPDGRSVAVIDHRVSGDDGGSIVVFGPDRRKQVLTQIYRSAQGLVWNPQGDEIFFTAAAKGNARTLNAVSLSGRVRTLLSSPNSLNVFDSAPDGQLLIAQSNLRVAMFARAPGGVTD